MITPTVLDAESDRWQRELAQAIGDPEALIELLDLPKALLPEARAAARDFPLRVTRHYLGLIRPGDPDDALLRQVLPLGAECRPTPGYVNDPVGDLAARAGSGIVHKYHGRALLITTGACAIHCRYCFRRHYPYGEDNSIRHHETMLQQLRGMTDVSEVILSGGDPLSLSDRRLQRLLEALASIPHLERLRIHTRLPVVLPERITPHLVKQLATRRFATSLVLHVNHPRELSDALRPGLWRLRAAGVTLLNQSVLLRGVNDSAETLCHLSEALFDHGILPYYLHLLDPVAGAAHFEVAETNAIALHEAMRARLPGYLLPRLVREVPGDSAKRPVHR
ncbi:MAG: EF-P beta-lysylation protein EpmB [Gammaproteobacteria bacterium]|nr:MAG: EF-P beta-lysylation protein EpmB [Gammaproteobacteria bacterium]